MRTNEQRSLRRPATLAGAPEGSCFHAVAALPLPWERRGSRGFPGSRPAAANHHRRGGRRSLLPGSAGSADASRTNKKVRTESSDQLKQPAARELTHGTGRMILSQHFSRGGVDPGAHDPSSQASTSRSRCRPLRRNEVPKDSANEGIDGMNRCRAGQCTFGDDRRLNKIVRNLGRSSCTHRGKTEKIIRRGPRHDAMASKCFPATFGIRSVIAGTGINRKVARASRSCESSCTETVLRSIEARTCPAAVPEPFDNSR